MAQTYRQLQYDERCQIHALHRQGASARTIADQLHRHRSTIHRELRRNADPSGYCHQQAQTRSEQRRRQAASGPRKLHPPVWDRICDLLRMHWSPEQIAGRLRLAGDTSVSFSWLYRRIHQDRADGGPLHACLRQRGKPRRCKATKGSAGRGCIPGRTDISERPSIVDDKQRTGDREGDTIIGKAHQGAVVTLVDRRSKYTLTQAVTNRTAALVGGAVQDLLAPFTPLVHTLTFDNGKEFAGHRSIATSLATAIFFARPYHSRERGLNEHTNGLLHQFVPKSANLRTLDPGTLQDATDRLNHRPRKVLAYRTPHEVFSAACLAADIAPPPAPSEPRARGALWSRPLHPLCACLPVPANRPSPPALPSPDLHKAPGGSSPPLDTPTPAALHSPCTQPSHLPPANLPCRTSLFNGRFNAKFIA